MNEDYEGKYLLAAKAKELLVAIVSYYKTHPRAIKGGICCYSVPAGETRCAVGQFLREDVLEMIGEQEMSLQEVAKLVTGEEVYFGHLSLNPLFVEEAQGMPLAFWERAQDLHDDPKNWEAGPPACSPGCVELSEAGWDRLNAIAKIYGVTELITSADLISQ